MDIGIIGLGVAGISILKEIEKQTTKEMREKLAITVFSKVEGFGTGFPYQSDDEVLLLNQYTDTMSIDLDNKKDFLNWVKTKKQMPDLLNTHLPRKLFGEYLYEETMRLIAALDVDVVREKVEAVSILENNQYKVRTRGTEKNVHSVHLSIGHLAYQDPYELKGNMHYIYNPYPAKEKLIFPDEEVKIAIIGTGLTAIDTYLYIKKTYPKAQLSFLSLEGRFSSVRGHEPENETEYSCRENIQKLIEENNGTLTLEQVREWFTKETRRHAIDLTWIWKHLGEGTVEGMQVDLKHSGELGKFQALIRKMRECYVILWNALPDEEKDKFLKEYGQKWGFFKAPIPEQTARILIKDLTEERAELLSGIQSIKKEEQFNVTFNKQADRSYHYIVNGTGQEMNLSNKIDSQQPVVKQLLDTGVLTPHRYGGALVDYPSMCAIDAKGEVLSGFRVYGQLVSGVQYGNSSVEMVAKSARYGVKDMLQKLQ